jgi:hypothetical protein
VFSFGTGDFTVECWIYPTASPSNIGQIIGGHNSGSNADWILALFGSTSYPSTPNYIGFYGTNGGTQFFAGSAITFNQWTHVAIVVQSTVPKIYYNGVLSNTGTASQIGSLGNATAITIGDDNTGNANSVFTGYISNLRVVKGLAVYTGAFTPSLAPLQSTQSAGTNIAAITGTATSLLTCQSNRFIDNGTANAGTGFTITATGTPQVTPYYYPSTFTAPVASTGAVFFNGSTDYLSLPGSTTSLYLPGAFTWEAWVYPMATNGLIYGTWNDAASNPDGWAFWYNNAGSFPATGNTARIYWYDGNYGANECAKYSTTALPTYQWNHLVFQRDGSNVIKFFLNGVSLTLANVSVNGKNFDDTFAFNNTAPIGIGGSANGVYRYTGYISNMRFVQSTAVYAGNFTPPTGSLTQTGGTYPITTNVNVSITAANTKLLLNGLETNYTSATNGVQNNTFIDGSPYAFTITRNGTPTQGSPTPYWPNGYWSNYLDGSSSINFASLNAYLTTGECTVEAWVNCSSFAGSPTIVGNSNWSIGQNCGWTFQITTSGTISFLASAGVFNTYPAVITTTSTITLNTWNHVAFVRNSSNVCRIYINGVDGGGSVTYASSFNLNSGVSYRGTEIGTRVLDGTRYQSYTGYVSNVRIVNNTAVYTSTFTPPTTPLAATQSAGTNISAITGSSTSLLTCQSNRIIDNSNTNYTPTITGTPRVQSFQPFRALAVYTAAAYGGSGYFNGNPDKLSIASNTVLALGTDNFTIEFWVYNQSTTNRMVAWPTAGAPIIYFNTSNFLLYENYGTATVLTSSIAVPLYTWAHIVVCRSNAVTKIFINGVQGASGADSNNWGQNGINIGADVVTTFMTGYLSNLRIVKGTAVYTSAFTPPVTPVTAITNTILLVNFANAAIYDAAVQNAVTTVGDAQASITQYQWSPTSIKFDGTGDYINISAGSPQNLTFGTGDFTIEFWVYFTSNTGFQTLYDGRPSAGAYPLLYLNNGVINYYVGSSVAITSVQPSINTWYFMSLRRSSGTTQFFINGTQSGGNYTDSNNYLAPPTSGARVGANYPGSDFLFGYIQDYRITKGVARPATPIPTAAFPTR